MLYHFENFKTLRSNTFKFTGDWQLCPIKVEGIASCHIEFIWQQSKLVSFFYAVFLNSTCRNKSLFEACKYKKAPHPKEDTAWKLYPLQSNLHHQYCKIYNELRKVHPLTFKDLIFEEFIFHYVVIVDYSDNIKFMSNSQYLFNCHGMWNFSIFNRQNFCNNWYKYMIF